MYVGFVALEGTLSFLVLTENTSEVPTDADSTPTYDVHAADFSSVFLNDQNVTTLGGVTGAYYVSQAINASAGFAAGNTYTLLATWEISAAARAKTYTFTVT